MINITQDKLYELIDNAFINLGKIYKFDDERIVDVVKTEIKQEIGIEIAKNKKALNLSAYNLFIKDQMKNIPKDITPNDYFKQCTKVWNKLSDEEKKKYEKPVKIKLKKPTNYQIFVQNISKSNCISPHDNILSFASKKWNSLSQDEKNNIVPIDPVSDKYIKSPRKKNGYNCFFKYASKELIKDKPKEIGSMKYISSLWNNLSSDEKLLWSTRD